MAQKFKFTTPGAFSWTVPSDVTQVSILIVGGGGSSAEGGGSTSGSGGGGAGEVKWIEGVTVTPGQTLNGTVGAGGQPVSGTGSVPNNGGDSSFDGTTAIGGGGGGGWNGAATDGGSGGGGGDSNGSTNAGGAATGTGMGNAGGAGFDGGTWGDGAGGGGGAGAIGQDGTASAGGTGGDGFEVARLPNDGDGGWFGGGGGGGAGSQSSPATGGKGGGGSSQDSAPGTDAMPNTGGGGGGGSVNGTFAGAGGSGVVILITPAEPELTLDRKTNSSLEVSWANIDGANGDADDWTVEASQGGSVVDTFTATQESAEITGLAADTATDVTITGSDSGGQGTPFTKTFTTSPAAAPSQAPDASVAVNLQTMAVDWTLQDNVRSYIVELQGVNGNTIQALETTGTSAEFQGEAFTDYQIAVIPSNGFGNGPAALLSAVTEPWLNGAAVDLVFDGTPTPAQGASPADPTMGLAGTVQDASGAGLESRDVHIYRRDNGERVATVTSAADGTWQWTGADPAAEYFVVAINPADGAQDFVPSAANRLEPVTI